MSNATENVTETKKIKAEDKSYKPLESNALQNHLKTTKIKTERNKNNNNYHQSMTKKIIKESLQKIIPINTKHIKQPQGRTKEKQQRM